VKELTIILQGNGLLDSVPLTIDCVIIDKFQFADYRDVVEKVSALRLVERRIKSYH